MHSLLKYTWAVVENYTVHSVDVRVMDIEEGMMPSGFLTAISTETYISFVRAAKIIINHNGVFYFRWIWLEPHEVLIY